MARFGRGRVVARGAIAALLLAGCVGEADPSQDVTPAVDPRVSGTLLVRAGFGGTFELVELPTGEVTPLRMPRFFRTVSGFFDDDGSVIGLLELPDGVRLYRLFPDREPVVLGEPLRAGDTLTHAAGRVLVTACGMPAFAYVLDLAAPRWREVDAGCGATLSPDGGSAAWSPDGSTLVEAPLDGSSPPEPVADLADLEVPEAARSEAMFASPIAWAPEGRAVLLSSVGWQGVAVLDEPAAVTTLGDRGAGPLQVYLDWQPDAPVLAVGSSTTLGGAVRLVDDGGSRVIALFREPATGTAWAPDGDAVLAASNGVWAVVSPEGEWLWSRIVGRGQEPLDWWGPS